MHSCAICDAPFLPDSTIYPDPNDPTGTRFLCRICFTENGGSRGICAACGRPVLALKSEGTFVTAADKVWHNKCFTCDGCSKRIGDAPMVDLLGKPSCVDCFDNCLKRDRNTPKKNDISHTDKSSNLGGLKSGKSREGSPAIEELEQRLGITKSRESSPALDELSHTLRIVGRNMGQRGRDSTRSPLSTSLIGNADLLPDGSPNSSRIRVCGRSSSQEGSDSPTRITPIRYTPSTSSPRPAGDSTESMKRRFLKSGSSSPAPSHTKSQPTPSSSPRPLLDQQPLNTASKTPPLSKIPVAMFTSRQSPSLRRPMAVAGGEKKSVRVRRQGDSAVPDLVSDHSDTTTQSSGPNSPPRDEGEIDVFDDHDTIRGRSHSRNTGIVKPLWGGYRKGDYLNDDLTTPASGLHTESTAPSITPKLASSLTADKGTPGVTILTNPPSATCARCNGLLFNLHSNAIGGRFVTVPEEPRFGVREPKMYHTDCFRCSVCDGTFKERESGKAVFVRGEGGACHVEVRCSHISKVASV